MTRMSYLLVVTGWSRVSAAEPSRYCRVERGPAKSTQGRIVLVGSCKPPSGIGDVASIDGCDAHWMLASARLIGGETRVRGRGSLQRLPLSPSNRGSRGEGDR